MSEIFKPIYVDGATVYFIGRTGSRNQHRVFSVFIFGGQYNVCIDENHVEIIREMKIDGKINRFTVGVTEAIKSELISIAIKAQEIIFGDPVNENR